MRNEQINRLETAKKKADAAQLEYNEALADIKESLEFLQNLEKVNKSLNLDFTTGIIKETPFKQSPSLNLAYYHPQEWRSLIQRNFGKTSETSETSEIFKYL